MSYECDTCNRCFNSDSAKHQHMMAKNHFAYECRCCSETWPTVDARRGHEADSHSYYHCSPCDRGFSSSNRLQQHLHSRIHLGTTISCPNCRRGFTSATGVTHHLERGACPAAPGLNRDRIYKLVRSKDTRGVISKKLLTWDGSSTGDAPAEATSRAWNGASYECYLCHRGFTQLVGLNQHLQSPVHMQDLYHCPQGTCQRNFKTLAALVNHFESESCGFIRFGQVQCGIHDMVGGRRLLGY